MFINTELYRSAALYYQKHGKYDCGVKGSAEYKRWWKEQGNRCLKGYSVGGVHITGYHYNYLNFNKILTVNQIGNSKAGNRKLEFPKFWDLDYMFFKSMHIAKYGISIEDLRSLPYSIPLKEDEANLSGGHHLIWLKQRGSGASNKNASMASRNFHHVPKSKTFLLADNKEYLNKDGIYSKFQELRSWVNTHTEFARKSDFKKGQAEMHYRASEDDGAGNELGSMAEVMGITTNGNPEKARGKRGILLLFEEGGKFPEMDTAWNIARDSVEEGGIVYGTLVGFGTGGSEGADFRSMELMFDNPRAYNILAFNNIYDVGLEGNDCALFTPAFKNVQLTDKDGNSDEVKGKEFVANIIAEAELSPDVTLVAKRKAENPSSPREAMLSTDTNKFAREELVQWRYKLFANNYYKSFGTPKLLYTDENGQVKSRLNTEILPIFNYPHTKKQDLRGSVVEYATPFRDDDGTVPDDLYIIGHDPYADDDAQDVTSLGSAYVVMNENNIVPNNTGNRIVASYNGRPRTTDEYNYNLFLLARRWNAKIGFESDRGDVVSYAKRFNMLHLLAPEFELGWDEKIKVVNSSTYRYGMKMGSGALNIKILNGNKYIEDWLFEGRTENEKNDIICNFHYIYDIGLLDELRFFNGKGNYDRISALRVVMYYMRELAYSDTRPASKKKRKKSFSKFISKG